MAASAAAAAAASGQLRFFIQRRAINSKTHVYTVIFSKHKLVCVCMYVYSYMHGFECIKHLRLKFSQTHIELVILNYRVYHFLLVYLSFLSIFGSLY